MKTLLKTVLLTTLLTPAIAFANETHDTKHSVGLFAGVTIDHGESENSYGLEYEYKINTDWGVGLVYEETPDAHHEDGVTVKLASVYAHPMANWRLGLGFGKEEVGGAHSFSENLIRTSVSYDFHVAGFGIAPSLAFDTVDGETATVVGIALLKSF